jgi:lysyl-tRNA synthetase, class I
MSSMGKKELNVKHWADQIADEVIERVENDPRLKKLVEKTGYFVYDEKTPSGIIHIGSGRGWIIHDAIAKALRNKGKNAKFVLSSDDHDPLDKVPSYLDKEIYEKYMGVPFKDIPSPVEGYSSFGDYYFKQCTDLFDQFGIEAELESTGEEYEKGVFNVAIKKILNNTDKVQKVYAKLYGDDTAFANRLPFNVRCPNCGKVATTATLEWDSKKEEVYYECKNDVVKWANGCGNKGWISPYDRNGKLPWKIEWAVKWPSKNVIVETAGKDHFTKNGSRTVACRISTEILDYPSPYPSKGYYTGPGYEFFTVGGKKMSTSKGTGVSFYNSMDYAPAKMLRFLLIRTRPNAVIDFQPYNTNDLILLYERYDKTERIYYGVDDEGEKENIRSKRIYELSHIGKISEKMPPQVSLTHAGNLVQIFDDDDEIIQKLIDSGNVSNDVDLEGKKYIKERLSFARKWISEFAQEQYKFSLQNEISENIDLNEKQKEAIRALTKTLQEKKLNEKELHQEFYDISKNINIETREFFTACYKVLLNKEKGPKLAPFIIALGKKAIDLFEKL